jgi:anti-anti-sigma regulatory factor
MFEKNDGQIVLCCASDYIENLFKITKLNLIFKIFPTQFDAEMYFTKLPAEEK